MVPQILVWISGSPVIIFFRFPYILLYLNPILFLINSHIMSFMQMNITKLLILLLVINILFYRFDHLHPLLLLLAGAISLITNRFCICESSHNFAHTCYRKLKWNSVNSSLLNGPKIHFIIRL